MAIPVHPRLRRDITWRRFVVEGQDTYVFRDDISNDYVKLDVCSSELALAMDGARSEADLLAYAEEKWPGGGFDADFIADLVADLRRLRFLDDPFEKNAMLAARARQERAKITASTFKNLLSIEIGTFDPEKLLNRLHPHVDFLFRPFFVWLGIALFCTAGYVVWLDRSRVSLADINMFAYGFPGVAALWLTIGLAIFIHELGHAFAVKHYGGRVPAIGILFLYGLPAMFCDTSDSHMFPERRQRAVVALAGTYTELYGAALGTLVWWLTPAGTLVNALAYNLVLFSSVTGILFNYNPLIKLDGYFVLADSLDMSELQEDSYAYVGYLFRRYVLRMKMDCPALGRRRKWILFVYGALSLTYAVAWTGLIYLLFRGFLVDHLAIAGSLISLFLLYALLKRPARPIARTARLWALDHRGAIRRSQVPLVAAAGAFLLVFLLLPVPGGRAVSARLAPGREEVLVAPEDLRLARTMFFSGQEVHRGDTLVVLDADSLRTGRESAAASARARWVEGEGARLRGERHAAATSRSESGAEATRSDWLARRVERAVLRAPFDGRVLTASVRGLDGEMLAAGDTLCRVGDFSRLRASTRVSETDLDDVRRGAVVKLRLRAEPGRTLHGWVEDIEPLAAPPRGSRQYRAWIALDDAPRAPRAGLTGRAWIQTPARTPAAHVLRAIARFVRLDLWV